MKAYDDQLTVASQVAREAGAYLREAWQHTHTTHSKGYRDVVTEADFASEKIIIGRLRAAFPDHAITSEEAGADVSEKPIRWLIDPIDGTTNFSRNNPNFCISIAAVEAEKPIVGIVYDPLRDHLFAAQHGGGATLNGETIHTSNIKKIEAAVCAADWGRDVHTREAIWLQTQKLLDKARTLRALGSAALNMVYVAAGWIDLYLSLHLYPWDQAAAALIVQEAGGAAETVSGRPWTPQSKDPLIGATPTLIEAFRALSPGVPK